MKIDMPTGWQLVTASTQDELFEKLFAVKGCPAVVHLHGIAGPVDVGWWFQKSHFFNDCDDASHHIRVPRLPHERIVRGVIISGGDSPLHPSWVRSIRDQCVAAEVPFYFRSWGRYVPVSQGPLARLIKAEIETFLFEDYYDAGTAYSGSILDGQTWTQLPEGVTTR